MKHTVYNNHFNFIPLKYEITYVYSKNKLFLDSHRSVHTSKPLQAAPVASQPSDYATLCYRVP